MRVRRDGRGTSLALVATTPRAACALCSKRHGLPFITVFTEEGRMTDGCGEFAGLMRFDAREAVCKRLAELGLSRGEADNKMRLGVCSRSGDIIEPLIKPQWYVSCRQMGADAAAAVREGRLRLVPDHHNATWYHWLDNAQVGGGG